MTQTMTSQPSLAALILLGDLLERKEAELSAHDPEEQVKNLNELWELYQELLS